MSVKSVFFFHPPALVTTLEQEQKQFIADVSRLKLNCAKLAVAENSKKMLIYLTFHGS